MLYQIRITYRIAYRTVLSIQLPCSHILPATLPSAEEEAPTLHHLQLLVSALLSRALLLTVPLSTPPDCSVHLGSYNMSKMFSLPDLPIPHYF